MNRLVAKLEERDALSEEEKAALEALPTRSKLVAAGQSLIEEGDRPTESSLLVKGFAARYNMVPNGRRQITALHIAGDFVDLHSFLLHTMDHGVFAVTECVVAMVPHEALRKVTEQFPHLTRLLWLSTLIDSALHRRWLVAMGAMSSVAHLAHLICELHVRLGLVGLAQGDSYELPLTQAQIAEVLGLSLVHVNRITQELRATGMIEWKRNKVTILQRERLVELAAFNPDFLHLGREPR